MSAFQEYGSETQFVAENVLLALVDYVDQICTIDASISL